ncbi:hypothetical protein GCM10010269_62290 [Streptomyces humidus]|uniref:Uncharacterized protein n=1 Tax=Streptomyces humidus TaxID=52259 RepID=A0A918G343_9ACTN|nr:hypothetical protein [Streptomyces humidus]GGS14674.1 hypothetical protein GCM10010269_62290 [Streptomyces humidus]
MSAWIILCSGCFVVVLGVSTLTGSRGIAAYTRSPRAGWGGIAMGGGFVLDGGARLLGLSSGAGMVVSTIALGVIVLGAVFQLRAGMFARARHAGDADRAVRFS